MKSFIIAIIFLVIGGAVGGFLALSVGKGVGAGAGLVVGTQAGACMAVEAAKERGLLSGQQINQVIADTVGKIKGKSTPKPDAPIQWVGNEADCAKMVAEMEKPAKSQK